MVINSIVREKQRKEVILEELESEIKKDTGDTMSRDVVMKTIVYTYMT